MLWDFAVRSMIYRRVTAGIIENVEIDPASGESAEWYWVGVSLC